MNIDFLINEISVFFLTRIVYKQTSFTGDGFCKKRIDFKALVGNKGPVISSVT